MDTIESNNRFKNKHQFEFSFLSDSEKVFMDKLGFKRKWKILYQCHDIGQKKQLCKAF